MPYTRILRLGSTTFPTGSSVAQVDVGRTIGSQKLARAHGMRQTLGYHNGVKVEVRVPLISGPFDASLVRPRIDAVRVMLDQGPANLYFHDDRYYRCVESEHEPTVIGPTGFDRIHELSVSLIGPDDVLFSTALSTDTWTPTNGVSHTLTPDGNANAYPKISLTVGGAGLETVAFTVTNETNSEEFTLAGDVTAADVIVIDCLLKTSKIGTTNRLDLFDGLFLAMEAGANQITISWTSSSVTSVTVEWRDRWLTL